MPIRCRLISQPAQSILYDAVDPTSGVCMALTCDYGPWMVAAWGAPSPEITLRADLLGYGSTDPVEVNLMDWAVYAGAALKMSQYGAGYPDVAEDNGHRVEVLTGYDFPEDDLEYFLMESTKTRDTPLASSLSKISVAFHFTVLF